MKRKISALTLCVYLSICITPIAHAEANRYVVAGGLCMGGAIAGSVVPIIGTLVGCAAGAFAGAFWPMDDDEDDAAKEEQPEVADNA